MQTMMSLVESTSESISQNSTQETNPEASATTTATTTATTSTTITNTSIDTCPTESASKETTSGDTLTTTTTNKKNKNNTPKQLREPREPRAPREPKEPREPKQQKQPKQPRLPRPPKTTDSIDEKKERTKQVPPPHTTKRKPLDLKSLSINEKCEMEGKGGKSLSRPPASATQVLPHLFLGSAVNAADAVLVCSLGLGCVLNVAEELEEIVKHDGVENVRMVVHDFTPEGMDQYSVFEEAFVLIDKARESGKPVLVHCMRGRSRSATIVIAYLMSREKWSLKESHSHVKKLRPYIGPHRRLKKQLMNYERHLYGNISVGPGEGWQL